MRISDWSSDVCSSDLLAVRGVGIFMSMWIAGQLIGRIDARWLVGSGLIIAAYSLWQMSHWSLMMGTWPVIVSGLVQGLGMGLIFIPLNRSEERRVGKGCGRTGRSRGSPWH